MVLCCNCWKDNWFNFYDRKGRLEVGQHINKILNSGMQKGETLFMYIKK